MKKKLALLMLSIAAVLCMIGFVACSNDTEDPPATSTDPTDPPATNTEPTLQEQYDAFCEFIENDTDKYTLSLSMEQAGEKVTEMLSVASDRVYGKMTSEEYSQESYVWLNEDYAYTRTTYNNKTEHSVEYMPGHSFGIRTMLNELSKELLYTEDFLASLQDNIAVANDAITFSFEDTRNGISCQNGTLSFAEDSVKINFDLLLLNLPVYDPSDAIVAVQIEINALGTNTVEFPFEPETEFAGITTLDRLYAQMVWVLDAESATLDVQMSGSSLMGEGTETPFTMQLSGGEAFAEMDIGGSATIEMGVIYKDNTFFYITETTSGAQSSMEVITEEYGYTVAGFFEMWSFNLRTKECFMLADGSETQLTLSEQGKQWYVYCDELLIDFSKPGEYFISAKLNEPGMPESLICTIKDVGIEKEIEFPDSWKEYVAFYVGGIHYTDVSVSDAYEAEATSLEQYNSDLIIPESITVNGQAYSVVSLNSSFLNGYGYSLNTIVIPSTIVNMNGALSGSFNLDYLYYCGTQAAFEEVAGSTLPQGTIVYYYSEEQPQGEGNYWHWNEAHTAAVRWPGGEEPAVQYQVYFDTNGQGYLDNSSVYATIIEEAPIPSHNYEDQYIFAGWYTDPNCSDGSEVAFPYTVTENITLYAKWEENFFKYELNESKTGYIVTYYNRYELPPHLEQSFNVVIPQTYQELPVVAIGSGAFEDKYNIASVSLPDSIISIGTGAFRHSSIKSINFPSALKYIDAQAFMGCYELLEIEIPSSVEYIGREAFNDCYDLTGITVDGDNGAYCSIGGVLYDKAVTEIYAVPKGIAGYLTIPNGITFIDSGEFSDCLNLTGLTLPNTINHIGRGAFDGCNNLTDVKLPNNGIYIEYMAFQDTGYYNNESNWENGALYLGKHLLTVDEYVQEKFSVKEGTLSIAESAFEYGNKMKSIYIPNSVTVIAQSALPYGNTLEEISVGVSNAVYIAKGNCLIDKNTKTLLAGCKNSVIPLDLEIETIGAYAFYGCSDLTELVIPASVTTIGSQAFNECRSLDVTFENGSKIRNIDFSAFNNCNLTTTQYEQGKYIGSDENPYLVFLKPIDIWIETCTLHKDTKVLCGSAFDECQELMSVQLNEGLLSIGSSAFRGCDKLTELYIPDSVEIIGNWAFSLCRSLTKVTIGQSVESIGEFAFSSCENLEEVIFSENCQLRSLGWAAFSGCEKLHSMALPKGVIEIDNYAFSGCFSLTNIILPKGVTNIGMEVLSMSEGLEEIYYTGTPEDWMDMSVDLSNSSMFDATIYYYSENEPKLNADGTAYDGDYWHYVDGVPMVWEKGTI